MNPSHPSGQYPSSSSKTANSFFYSYHAPKPDTLQTFANQEQAPYGYPDDYEIQALHPAGELGDRKLFHVKVTATPINIPPGVDTPEYEISAHPVAPGFPSTITSRDGARFTHIPSYMPGQHGFTIKPLMENLPSTHDSEKADLSPEMKAEGYVQQFAGKQAVATRSLLAKQMEQAGGAIPGTDVPPHSPKPQIPPGSIPLEKGYARNLSKQAVIAGGPEEERQKIYNWIIATDDKSGDLQQLGSIESKDFGEQGRLDESQKLFAAASAEFAGTEIGQNYDLDSVLRPTVRYGGVEFAPPEFVGTKGPLNYKLHAVEIHQFIPLPSFDEPWFSKNRLDPATSAIFGPMPLPFDPANSGMVAPTFQQSTETALVPTLSPEMAKMFNQELPVSYSPPDMPKPQ